MQNMVTSSFYNGYLSVNSFTIPRTSSEAASPSFIILAMHSATLSISVSVNPLDVIAGVPSLTPLVTNGDNVSKGIVFLLVVIFALSRAI